MNIYRVTLANKNWNELEVAIIIASSPELAELYVRRELPTYLGINPELIFEELDLTTPGVKFHAIHWS